MNKIKYLLALVIVLSLAMFSYGDAPTNSVVDGWFLVHADTAIDTNGAFDTLAATDSSTILSAFNPKYGWEYLLQRDAFTGTGSDSIDVELRVDCKDRNGNVYQYYAFDSTTAAAGETYLIPFGSKVFGDKFDIKLRSYTGSGTQIIINRLRLWRRRAQTTALKRNMGQ